MKSWSKKGYCWLSWKHSISPSCLHWFQFFRSQLHFLGCINKGRLLFYIRAIIREALPILTKGRSAGETHAYALLMKFASCKLQCLRNLSVERFTLKILRIERMQIWKRILMSITNSDRVSYFHIFNSLYTGLTSPMSTISVVVLPASLYHLTST